MDRIPKEKKWKNAGFDNAIWSPAIGRSGGIGVLWKSQLLTHEIISLDKQRPRHITIAYKNTNSKFECKIIFIYAPPMERDKDEFWIEVETTIEESDIPCIIIGDMNDIVSSEDKLGGAETNPNRFTRLLDLKNKLDLIDLPFSGNRFTWRKKFSDNEFIYERLDGVFVQNQIINKYPNL